ncbi:hypothetical protein ACSVBT_17100 [Afipia sp. TerB]
MTQPKEILSQGSSGGRRAEELSHAFASEVICCSSASSRALPLDLKSCAIQRDKHTKNVLIHGDLSEIAKVVGHLPYKG